MEPSFFSRIKQMSGTSSATNFSALLSPNVTVALAINIIVVLVSVTGLILSVVTISTTTATPAVLPTTTVVPPTPTPTPTVVPTPTSTVVPTPTVTPTPTPTQATFSDATFRIDNVLQPTALFAFDNQYISTESTRTYTLPNTDSTLVATPNATSLALPLTENVTVSGSGVSLLGVQSVSLNLVSNNNTFFGYNSASSVSETVNLKSNSTLLKVDTTTVNINNRLVIGSDSTLTISLPTPNIGFYCNAIRNDATNTNYVMYNPVNYEVTYYNSLPSITPQALKKLDDSNVTLTLGGNSTQALVASTSINVVWSGALSVVRGGTGTTITPVAGTILSSASASALDLTVLGSGGQFLQSRGTAIVGWSTYGTSFGVGTTAVDSQNASILVLSQTRAGQNALLTVDAGTLSGGNTAYGSSALYSLTDSASNVSNCAFGYRAGYTLVTGADNVFWGEQSANLLVNGSKNIVLGSYALGGCTASNINSNIAIGYNALGNSSYNASSNIAIGTDVLNTVTTGSYNIAVGIGALVACTTGSNNICLGGGSLTGLTTGSRNVVIGRAAQTAAATAVNDIVGIGYNCMLNNVTSNCTGMGSSALLTSTNSVTTTAFGFESCKLLTPTNLTAMGYQSAPMAALTNGFPDYTSLGSSMGIVGTSTTGTFEKVVCGGAGVGPTGDTNGSFSGIQINNQYRFGFRRSAVMGYLSTISGNVIDYTSVGYLAAYKYRAVPTSSGVGGSYPGCAIGARALDVVPPGVQTIFSNCSTVVVGSNTCLRNFKAQCVSVGYYNAVNPPPSGLTPTLTILGCKSAPDVRFARVVIGNQSCINVTTANPQSLGHNALPSMTIGTGEEFPLNLFSRFIGHSTDCTTGTNASSILLGMGAISTADAQLKIGFGTVANQSCYIDGIVGITTGVADAIGVMIDVNGQLGTVSSSIRYKTHITPIPNSRYWNLRATTYFRIGQLKTVKQLGYIAEEVSEVDDRLVSYDETKKPNTVHTQYMEPIALSLIRDLNTQVKSIRERLRRLRAHKK